VAPLVNQCETVNPSRPPVRDVYLPSSSNWYAFTDNLEPLGPLVRGGTLVTNWYASLNNPLPYLMPIYIRAGAIIPMTELEQYVGQLPQNPITFNVYPGPDSWFQLYQDDGVSNNYRTGKCRLTTVSHQGIPGGQRVRVLRIRDQYTPPEAFYFISFLGTNPPTSVAIGGGALPDVFTPAALWSASGNAYYYNQSIKTTFAKLFDTASDITLKVTF
jgi:alpha-glucosidase